jgi:undecaprenyl diphosphate synthase
MYDFKGVTLPIHVAIIMDGNGRWAKQRNLPRVEGHTVGVESVRDVVTVTRELKIPYLTLYAFSKENWSRPKKEITKLFQLLETYLDEEMPTMIEKGIRFNTIGDLGDFPRRLHSRLDEAKEATRKNKNLVLSIALSYSAREEILNAVRLIAEDAKKDGLTRINEKVFKKYLYTKDIPDPDFLIRTSGEMRLSNFLLWQLAYTELYITDTFWPDFRKEEYEKALWEFTKRDRRFGNVKDI